MTCWKQALVLVSLLVAPAGAAPIASLTKVEGATVTLNRGRDEQIQAGTHLFIVRAGKTLAEVEVDQVGETSSRAKVVRIFGSDSCLAGDVVNTENSNSGTTYVPTGGPPGTGPATLPRTQQFRPLPLDLTMESAESRYRDSYEARTQRKDFRQVVTAVRSNEEMMPGMQLTNIYMAADLVATSFGPGGFYGDPSYLLMSAWQAYEGRRQRDKLFDAMDVKLQAEVTLWDQDLLESYGQYAALVNGFSEPHKYQDFMRNLASQKGVTGGRVFEVRLRNTGQLKAQLAPFNWHIFMVGPNESKVGALRYDPALDRQIDPKREVSGNVYFPMVASSGSKVQIVLEDMYGDRGQIDFSIDR